MNWKRIGFWTLSLIFLSVVSCRDRHFDRNVARENWDGVISSYGSNGKVSTYGNCCLNIALARGGRLADEAFSFYQLGPGSLIPERDLRLKVVNEVLSDIMYEAGYVAEARSSALEAEVISSPGHNLRMIKRLVQTSLIYEDWAVAEKYICFLEREGGKSFRRWARGQRCYLYNPEVLEADSEYGEKRKCIPEDDFIPSNTVDDDLKKIIRANPKHRNTVEILGVWYLLKLDLKGFIGLLDEFYGTEALDALPKSFAEAVCLIFDGDSSEVEKFGVSEVVLKRYRQFLSRMEAGLSLDAFDDTWWMYVARRSMLD